MLETMITFGRCLLLTTATVGFSLGCGASKSTGGDGGGGSMEVTSGSPSATAQDRLPPPRDCLRRRADHPPARARRARRAAAERARQPRRPQRSVDQPTSWSAWATTSPTITRQDGAYTLGTTARLALRLPGRSAGQGGWPDWNAGGTFVNILTDSADAKGVVPMFTLYAMASMGRRQPRGSHRRRIR